MILFASIWMVGMTAAVHMEKIALAIVYMKAKLSTMGKSGYWITIGVQFVHARLDW